MNFTEDKDYFFIKKPVYIRLLILIKHKKDKNMKKIIVALTMLVISTVSSKALDASSFSVTAGIAGTQGIFGASATETNRNDSNVISHVKKEHGVFTDSYASGFIELNAGDFISIGYEHTPDSITTPTNTTRQDRTVESNVAVDFNDFNTAYLKLNVPGGLYVKAGYVETDIDVKESMGSGSTYNNVSTDGTVVGIGYERSIADSRIGIRFEGSYLELDDVTSSNGVTATGATVANSGQNTITASNLEGLQGKVAVTITLGN